MKKMNTVVISAFPGCGKTYLSDQKTMPVHYMGKLHWVLFLNINSSEFPKYPGWHADYVDHVESKIGTVDFIFVSQHENVLFELTKRKIPFVVVAPDNSEWLSEKEKSLIKQQWFGRFLLRNNSHIKDFGTWLESLTAHYDEWTSVEHLIKHDPVTFFQLKENQYMEDIIGDIYWKKERYPNLYCREWKD